MAARSDKRKQQEEEAVDPQQRALEMLADAIANAWRANVVFALYAAGLDFSVRMPMADDETADQLVEMVYDRLEPF